MMTAETMLSKRPVLGFTAALFFLFKLFLSHIYCIPKYIVIVCIYYCVTSKVTIDERINGFMVYNVILLFNNCADLRSLETGA